MDNASTKSKRFSVTGYVWGTLCHDGKIIWGLNKESAVRHANLFGLTAVQVEYDADNEARARDLSTKKLIRLEKIEYAGAR